MVKAIMTILADAELQQLAQPQIVDAIRVSNDPNLLTVKNAIYYGHDNLETVMLALSWVAFLLVFAVDFLHLQFSFDRIRREAYYQYVVGSNFKSAVDNLKTRIREVNSARLRDDRLRTVSQQLAIINLIVNEYTKEAITNLKIQQLSDIVAVLKTLSNTVDGEIVGGGGGGGPARPGKSPPRRRPGEQQMIVDSVFADLGL